MLNFDVSFLKSSGDAMDLDLFDDVSPESKYYLLVIAVDKYKYWRSLNNAVRDALAASVKGAKDVIKPPSK